MQHFQNLFLVLIVNMASLQSCWVGGGSEIKGKRKCNKNPRNKILQKTGQYHLTIWAHHLLLKLMAKMKILWSWNKPFNKQIFWKRKTKSFKNNTSLHPHWQKSQETELWGTIQAIANNCQYSHPIASRSILMNRRNFEKHRFLFSQMSVKLHFFLQFRKVYLFQCFLKASHA